MLSTEQLATFERDGLVKVSGAFSHDDAVRMQQVLWRELERRHGMVRDDPSTWTVLAPTKLVSTKESRVFDPICSPAVVAILDQLMGAGRWRRPEQFGNVLVTMPGPAPWRVPHAIWHSDFEPGFPPDELFAVKLWALCDDLEPGGGGTTQLAGSHRLFGRFLETTDDRRYKEVKFAFLRSHPWLRALTRDDGEPDRNERFLDVDVDIDDLPMRVVVLTGRAGDVFVTHPWVFHSIATNARERPRFMRSVALYRRPAAAGA